MQSIENSVPIENIIKTQQKRIECSYVFCLQTNENVRFEKSKSSFLKEQNMDVSNTFDFINIYSCYIEYFCP